MRLPWPVPPRTAITATMSAKRRRPRSIHAIISAPTRDTGTLRRFGPRVEGAGIVARSQRRGVTMDWKLELVSVPVSDVDRAITFYVDQVGFNLDYDHHVSEDLRFVQITPRGSNCSIALGVGLSTKPPGSVEGLAGRRVRCRRRPGRAARTRCRRDRGPALPMGRLRVLQRSGRQRVGAPADPRSRVLRRAVRGPGLRLRDPWTCRWAPPKRGPSSRTRGWPSPGGHRRVSRARSPGNRGPSRCQRASPRRGSSPGRRPSRPASPRRTSRSQA